jgi:hypothetical protein
MVRRRPRWALLIVVAVSCRRLGQRSPFAIRRRMGTPAIPARGPGQIVQVEDARRSSFALSTVGSAVQRAFRVRLMGLERTSKDRRSKTSVQAFCEQINS